VNGFLAIFIAGLGAGGSYALLALGTVIVYKGSGLVNFASGGLALIGGAGYYEMHEVHHQTVALSLCFGVVLGAVAGLAVQLLVMAPMRRAAPLVRVIATLGVAEIIQQVASLRYGNSFAFIPSFLPQGSYKWGAVQIAQSRLVIVGLALGLTVVLFAFYRWTKFGLATAAVSESERVAASTGWSPSLVAAGNWALAGALSGGAGVVLSAAINNSLDPSTLTLTVVPTLSAAVLGGFSSFPVTMLGGLLIGVLEALPLKYVHQPGWSNAIPFLAILVVLVVRGKAVPLRSHINERLPSVAAGRIRVVPLAIAFVAAASAILALSVGLAAAAVTSLIFALIGLSVVAVLGYGGQLSLCQWAVAGVGALFAARLAAVWHAPMILVFLLALLFILPAGLLIAIPAIRVRGVSLAILTLALAQAINGVVFSNPNYTEGGNQSGVPQPLGIPRPSLFGYNIDPISHPARYALFCLVIVVLVALALTNVRRGRSGRRLLAARGNERAASSLGISITGAKLYAFGLASVLAGLAGVLIAYSNLTVEFGQFDALGSINVVLNGVIGGVGSVLGGLTAGLLGSGGVIQWVIGHAFNLGSGWYLLIAACVPVLTLMLNPDGVIPEIISMVGRARARVRRDSRPVKSSLGDAEVVSHRVAPRVLEIRGVGVSFGSTHALRDVSLTVRPGEVVGLIGPNGAGKTTLIDVASGYLRGHDGQVLLNEQPINRWNAAKRSRAGLTRSFQSLELFEDLTVEDNLRTASDDRAALAYMTDLVRPGGKHLGASALSSIREFGLEKVLDRYPRELSHAQRRLVAIARAVATEPSVLLLDEPAAGLDEVSSRELAELIRRLAKEWGMGVLFVEHDVEMVMSTCDRIVGLDFGAVIAHGEPAQVRKDEAMIKAYLGE
jgi:sulfate-transporting ATPase